MDTKLLAEIKKVLFTFPEYWEEEGLKKSKVIEDLRHYRPDLMKALFANMEIKDAYSLQIEDGLIFKADEFVSMLRSKNYWENSYTRFSNEIGLSSEGKYLRYDSDVVLDFPYKDCILEGGMTKEDVGKKEVYYHNVLAREEIDVMLSPKVLTNLKKFDEQGEHEITGIDEKDNLIIKGNNLIALHTLKERYAGMVKAVFIDPPYYFIDQKPADTFAYNSNFKLSSWLVFMRNRLEVAKELMDEKGIIYITISSEGAHYLKVLTDSIFGIENFIADITWQSRKSVSSDGLISVSSNHVLTYAKNKNQINKNEFRLFLDVDSFDLDDNDGRGKYKIEPFDAPNVRKNLQYPIENPNTGEVYSPPEGRCWRTTQADYKTFLADKRIRFGVKGLTKPQLKVYLTDAQDQNKGKAATTLWKDVHADSIVWHETSTTTDGTKHQQKLFDKVVFDNPKPEDLVSRAIQLATDENDIVLDFFMGSATTLAASMKMNRQFIGIEQMDYIESVSIPRLQKVIEGEQGGISKDVNWKGGGSFIYAELQELNMQYVCLIEKADDDMELNLVMEQLNESAYLNFKADMGKITNENNGFAELSLDEKKRLLIEVLDANQLYLNYSEIDDSKFNVPENVKAFNQSFYEKDGEEE
ncbi:DNA methyltransferase [Sporosarcina sp. NPDC096371]|uniref:DNA methyltransferase n=1 Tax=Sporosarcina sp. NPDC096371 TaxID=3364530 RepID=UPI0038134CC1